MTVNIRRECSSGVAQMALHGLTGDKAGKQYFDAQDVERLPAVKSLNRVELPAIKRFEKSRNPQIWGPCKAVALWGSE